MSCLDPQTPRLSALVCSVTSEQAKGVQEDLEFGDWEEMAGCLQPMRSV